MNILKRIFRKGEERQTIYPNGSIPISSSNFAEIFGGMFNGQSVAGVSVTTNAALGVPAVWAAVNFLSGTLASLPLHTFRRKRDGSRVRDTGVQDALLNKAANDEMTAYDWRKHKWQGVFTGGRGLSFIERTGSGRPENLFSIEPAKATIKKVDGRKEYHVKETGRRTNVYEASEVIDLPFMLQADALKHYGPIMTCKNDVGLAIALTNHASRFFQNGGVPPFAITGNFVAPQAMDRAGTDLYDAIRKAAKEERTALVLPSGLDIKSIGSDAEKSQLVEAQRFMIEQVARVYSLPPAFLQDLTHGTFSNTEQQDLQLVKHTITRWVVQFEQELNLKLFGRGGSRFVEHNLDGLLRGDFKTRMEGYATGVQNALLTPNEARRKENLPDDPDGNKLMIQGATVPVQNQMELDLGDSNND